MASKKVKITLAVIGVILALAMCWGVMFLAIKTGTQLWQSRQGVSSVSGPVEADSEVEVAPVVALPTLPPVPTPVSEQLVSQADAEELVLVNLYERVNPSVVNVDVVLDTAENLPDTGPNNEEEEAVPPEEWFPFFSPQGQGSGFVYSEDGYIITNNHVIEGAVDVTVTLANGVSLPAKIIGADVGSDLAVLKVDAPAGGLVPVTWGNSEELKVGQRAVAIGNPFGLEGTLTSGIISALKRSLPAEDGSFRIPEIIQIDAAVNPGNSGGPLLNSYGNVVGVVSAIVPRQMAMGERSFLGVGFAIPGNLVQRVVPELIKQGSYQHAWMGVVGDTVTPEIAQAMSLENADGALVIQVLSNSPAKKAGLRGGTQEFTTHNGILTAIGGDVIVKIDEEVVHNFDDLISFLSRRGEVGQTVTLTIIRDGKRQQLDLTLSARPSQEELFEP